MLPIPAKARGFSRVSTVHASVQCVHTAPVFGAESIDVRHEGAESRRTKRPVDMLRLIVRGETCPERIVRAGTCRESNDYWFGRFGVGVGVITPGRVEPGATPNGLVGAGAGRFSGSPRSSSTVTGGLTVFVG